MAWLRFGLFMSLLWLFLVRGGFVCPCRRVAFGVGFGRSVWQWFRFSTLLVGGRDPSPWLRSFACAVVSYLFSLFGAACWSTQAKMGCLRNKLVAFK